MFIVHVIKIWINRYKFTVKKSFGICYLATLAGILILTTSGAAAKDFTLDTARAAAATNDPAAEYFLAEKYADGTGVARDYSQAIQYLRQAAAQGYAPAQTGLASCYAHGTGVQQDYGAALQWYGKAAAQGDPLAQYSLGYACAHGIGTTTNFDEAVTYWQKAAAQGQVLAQYALGQFYLYGAYSGDTNHINYATAAQWLNKAATRGYLPAMGTMGYMYQFGVGVKHDWQQALRWTRPAALRGDPTAEDDLGLMYENANAGLSRDLVQAYKWFLLSSEQGDAGGKHDVIEFNLAHVLSPEQMAQAQKIAADFHPQTNINSLAQSSN
ncbi:MAG TPA: tetratricopeptide repeat protein [Verrucomicrobiae bacterium]|jgi:hypothetical protein